MNTGSLNLLITVLLAAAISCTRARNMPDSLSPSPKRSGPYLGNVPPDSVPGLFAPGVVSTGMFTRDMAITPDGKEIYFCVGISNYAYATILFTKEIDGIWTRPEIVPFSGGADVFDFEPAFSPDGSRLYFLSTRADGDEEPGDQDIWYVDRTDEGWGEPVNPGAPINTDGGEFFPSLTHDGTLYFTRNEKGSRLNRIFRSRFIDGAFLEPELLPDQVNCGSNRFNAFISPDESYIIVPAAGMKDAYDGVDYYLVFRDENDNWSEPLNMGEAVNKDNAGGWSPYVSPDAKAFFFMANRPIEIEAGNWNYEKLVKLYNSPNNGNADIYWMEASFIGNLRNDARWNPPG